MKIPSELIRDYGLWAAALLLAVLVAAALIGRRRPKEKAFICARCRKDEEHSPRTIQAWRDGKHKYFCQSCHHEWLRTKAVQVTSQKSGCLSALLVLLSLFGAFIYTLLKD